MSFDQFLASSQEQPELQFSPRESETSGLQVGRLTCGVNTDWKEIDPAQLILNSGFDLVIFRYPSDQFALAQSMQVPGLKSWVADTLMYFSVNVEKVASPDAGTSLELVTREDAEFDAMLEMVFAEYRNHYSSNTFLATIDVSQAYADWVRNQVASSAAACLGYRNLAGELAGLGVLQPIAPDSEELTLVGVHPEHRGKGTYLQVLRHLAKNVKLNGKTELITSTQSSNIASMRAWCREGFSPTLSINTLHVMKSDLRIP